MIETEDWRNLQARVIVLAMARRKASDNPQGPTIRFGEDDLIQLREMCDGIYSLYQLIRDRSDFAPISCLLKPMDRRFSQLVEGLEDRFEEVRTRFAEK